VSKLFDFGSELLILFINLFLKAYNVRIDAAACFVYLGVAIIRGKGDNITLVSGLLV
jgi:hypothetical protein